MKPEDLARSILDEELSAEEFDERVRQITSDETDIAEVRDLIAWFTRRYPSPFDRLAYVRRKVKALRATYGDRVVGK